jgi:two-component system, cell cycle sensor histidine kinase and response regulator CckA
MPRQRRVLMAEDNELVNAIQKKFLEDHLGFNVTSAKDGAEAVSLFRKCPKDFDLVILDVDMPIMNGIEASTAIHTLTPHQLILFATGKPRAEIQTLMPPGHSANILEKPFRLSVLREHILSLLNPPSQ